MFTRSLFTWILASSMVLSACIGPAGTPASTDSQGPSAQSTKDPVPFATSTASAPVTADTGEVQTNPEHHSDVDLTHLTVGDGKYTSNPQPGYVFTCMTTFNGNGGGAGNTGNWMNGDGTWDATRKAVVDGSISWPSSFTVSIQGDRRVFTGNDLPDHVTGNFPIASNDDAYTYDRNPNSIQGQTITLSLPANPAAAAQPNCVGGEVGIMLSGVVIFSAFDAEGRDAPAHEVQDNCDGHPQVSGFYHYHNLSDCLADNTSGHSALMGYAFDGFGIYGYYGEDGAEVTNADLDQCHGHTHTIEWDGQMVEMYHYHATHEFPYVVGCFHGEPAVRALSGGEGPGQQGTQGQSGTAGQPPQGGQGNGQPPQAALEACANLTVNSTCSVITPNGSLNGICMMPPGMTQLACVPAGGPPGP